jgi:pimeloyl-ACP methyl ester carboxylesterase
VATASTPIPQEDATVRLGDGRLLGYAVYGDPRGRPLFYFHGFPGSRFEAALAHTAAARLGIRLIAPDRPGFGLSTLKPRRSLLDWPADVAALADALGVTRFAVLGVSGGGPYALACASALPERLAATGLVAPLGPLEALPPGAAVTPLVQLVLANAARAPWLLGMFWSLAAAGIRLGAGTILRAIAARLPPADRAALARNEVRQALVRSLRESARQGGAGGAREMHLYGSDWGVSWSAIRLPVRLWHGEADTVVPPAMGRYYAHALPHCEASFLPNEGHYSLPLGHIDRILRALATD